MTSKKDLKIELTQAEDMLGDQMALTNLVAKALEVPPEPHQTAAERLVERAQEGGKAIHQVKGLKAHHEGLEGKTMPSGELWRAYDIGFKKILGE